jgi:hypothetical protein
MPCYHTTLPRLLPTNTGGPLKGNAFLPNCTFPCYRQYFYKLLFFGAVSSLTLLDACERLPARWAHKEALQMLPRRMDKRVEHMDRPNHSPTTKHYKTALHLTLQTKKAGIHVWLNSNQAVSSQTNRSQRQRITPFPYESRLFSTIHA